MANRYSYAIGLYFIALAGCMALPEQPSLTEKEARYINELASLYHCRVSRELDPSKPEERPQLEERGWYILSFDSLPCNMLLQKDTLKRISGEIAKKLHREILGKDFQYPYNTITILFDCNVNPTLHQSEFFEYSLQELENK